MSSPQPNSFGTQCATTLSEQPRVLLVDDNQAILDRASIVLSQACEIVGRAKDGPTALEAARKLCPDVIVLDISMPGMGGLEVADRLRLARSTAAIVFLTIHDDEEIVRAAKAAGGLAYVLKPRLASDLLPATLEASVGHRFVSSEVSNDLWELSVVDSK